MRYQSDRTHILKNQEVEIADDLSYVEEPVKNIDYKKNQLRNREIPLVKMLWRNHSQEKAIWEIEDNMK